MRTATLVAIFAIALCLFGAEESRALGPGIQALRGRLQDKSAEIRIEAAQGLSRVGGRQAVIILRDGLADKDADVRMAVVEALGFIGGRLALTVLSEALKDKAPQVRIRAVEALKDAGTVSAIPIIAKAFEDKERAVRLRAALVLRRIGHRSGVPVLGNAALNDNDPSVRAAATKHLGKVGVKDPRSVGLLAKILEDRNRPCACGLLNLSVFCNSPQRQRSCSGRSRIATSESASGRLKSWGASWPKNSNNLNKKAVVRTGWITRLPSLCSFLQSFY